MKIVRQMAVAITIALVTGGFSLAQEGHDHSKEDHEAMKENEQKIAKALSTLSAEDQKLAMSQRFCPIMTYDRLGAMGTPLKVMIGGKPVFVCCKSCTEDAVEGGEKTVKTVMKLRDSTATLTTLPLNERMAIEAQKYCAVAKSSFLGSMGEPIKLEIEGKPVYLCCDACSKKAKADPAATLENAERLIKAGTLEGHDHKH